jgi:hypothetical protein
VLQLLERLSHATQTPPPEPQLVRVLPGSQAVPEQQPVHEAAEQMHFPPLQD